MGDTADVTKLAGFEFTKYVTYSDAGEIIALRGLNVKNGKLILDEVKYIDLSDLTKLKRSKLYKDDILFTYVGTVGELAIVPEDDKYYLAPNVARIRLFGNMSPQFISQMMNDKKYYNKIIFPLIATSSQPALSMQNVRSFTLMLPIVEEQQLIGTFFKQLDDTIALHQRKLEKLELLKQGHLQLMFPRKGEKVSRLRFANFTSEWEQRKLGELLKVHQFKAFLAEATDTGIYEVIQQGYTPVAGYANGEPFKDYQEVILFGDHTVSLYKPLKPFFVATDGIKILSISGMKSSFLLPLLERYKPKPQGYKRHFTILKNEKVWLANDEITQEKIGILFKAIDDTINLYSDIIEKLKQLKKGYLQKLFI